MGTTNTKCSILFFILLYLLQIVLLILFFILLCVTYSILHSIVSPSRRIARQQQACPETWAGSCQNFECVFRIGIDNCRRHNACKPAVSRYRQHSSPTTVWLNSSQVGR